MPLTATLPLHAAQRPDAPAMTLGPVALSYAGLHAAARQAALTLTGLPRRAGSAGDGLPLAALVLGNHPQAPVWITAALAHPVVVALLDPAWPPALIAEVLARLAPEAVIVADDGAMRAATGHPILDLRQPLPPAPEATLPTPGPETAFFIGFTSGSTGMPKAFRRRRRAWRVSLAEGRAHFGLSEATATLAPGPLAHGLTLYALTETLEAGAPFTGLTTFSAPAMAAALAGARRLVGVPTMLMALMQHHAATGARFPDLTGITCAGARLDPALIGRLAGPAPNARITDYYGASELGFVATATHAPGAADPALGCGAAFPGVRIALRDGMVWVASPQVLDSYLWTGDGTGLRADGDWRSVGDLGRLDDQGRLHLMGRADGMAISGGHNIYPDEVAQALAAAPGVIEAEVLARPDPYLGQRIEAVLVLAPGGSAEAARVHAAARLPRPKLPLRIWGADALPRTASGKTARAELARWLDTGDARLTLLWPEVSHD